LIPSEARSSDAAILKLRRQLPRIRLQELQIESGARTIKVASALSIPKFASKVAASAKNSRRNGVQMF
jgi:hypothetical protein